MSREKLNKVVTSAAGKSKLQALRRAYDDVAGTIQERFNIRPQSTNWDFYKEKLGPSIVNNFEKSVDCESDMIAPNCLLDSPILVMAEEKEADFKRKIIAIDKELARIREEKEGLATITVDECYSKHPAVEAKIDGEIRNHNWA